MRFSADTYQNEYLAPGATRVDAIVTITASEDDRRADVPFAPPTAVVLVLDLSGSMRPMRKMRALRRAAEAAIHELRDGVRFALVRGDHEAYQMYPTRGLAAAGPTTRAEAIQIVKGVRAEGGTAIGRWLLTARDLLASTGGIRRAILLTDGEDASESREYLDAAIARCAGEFQCDCRGIGSDWRVDELRAVSSTLQGSLDIVAEPEHMAADFAALMRGAMAQRAVDVRLRLRLPRGAVLRFVKQVAPTIEDLTDRGSRPDPRTIELATGSWRDESRDYHVGIDVPAQPPGEEMLAGRVELVVDGVAGAPSLLRAIWTDDVAWSARIDPHVAHYTGQVELAAAIADGLQARELGDTHTASTRLGRAAQLAATSGNVATLQLLSRVVHLDDPATASVRLRQHVDLVDTMALDVRSTRTVRTPPPA